jgi:hypothetical protein
MGKEKRFCRRTVSSIRGAENVVGGVATGGREIKDGAPESLERNKPERDEVETSVDSSVCGEEWKSLELGVTCNFSS